MYICVYYVYTLSSPFSGPFAGGPTQLPPPSSGHGSLAKGPRVGAPAERLLLGSFASDPCPPLGGGSWGRAACKWA